jgi:hypothetical protein
VPRKFVEKMLTHAEMNIMAAINVAKTQISIINIRRKNSINHQAQINTCFLLYHSII